MNHPIHYTIDGDSCDFDYAVRLDGKTRGLMLDTICMQEKRDCSIQTHIDAALEYVREHKVPILFVYMHRENKKDASIAKNVNENVPSLQVLGPGEKLNKNNLVSSDEESEAKVRAVYDDGGVWEIYLNGHFLRLQKEPPTPEAVRFDFKKLSDIYQFINQNKMGSLANALHKSSRAIMKYDMEDEEREERLDEIDMQMDALAEMIDAMSARFCDITEAHKKLYGSQNVDEDIETKLYPTIDLFQKSIPNIANINYQKTAEDLFPRYWELTQKSRELLVTAMALALAIPEEQNGIDQAPVLFEMCRVVENELKLRIANPYLELIKDMRESNFNKNNPFGKLKRLLPKEPGDEIQFMAPIDFLDLLADVTNYIKECPVKTILRNYLKNRRFDRNILCNANELALGTAYFKVRNMLVHPSHYNDIEQLRNMRNEMIVNTNSRLNWLLNGIRSTPRRN